VTESQALDPEILPTQQSEADGEATKKGGFPSPLTILLLVLVGVWILGLVLPSGQYELNDAGAPIPGSFHEVPSPLDFRDSLSDLALSPGNGLFGVQDPTTGNVGPFNSGSLFGSAHRSPRQRHRPPRPQVQHSGAGADHRFVDPVRNPGVGHVVER